MQIDIGRERHAARVDRQDRLATLPVGAVHRHTAVEAAWAQQRLVEVIGAVGRRDDDHRLARVEAIHLDEQLVECLLALVVGGQAGAALAAHRVDLVDEDDARRGLLGLVEEIAHTACADADQHLDELGAGHREEGHTRLACHGARQQRLTGARRANQQDALRNLAAEPLELLRRLEELDDLFKLGLRLVHPRDIREGRAGAVLHDELGAAAPEVEDVLLALRRPPREPEEQRRPAPQSAGC